MGGEDSAVSHSCPLRRPAKAIGMLGRDRGQRLWLHLIYLSLLASPTGLLPSLSPSETRKLFHLRVPGMVEAGGAPLPPAAL